MTKALVVHPRWSIAGGGEYVCLNIIKALCEEGIKVTLMSSDYHPQRIEKAFRFNGKNFDISDIIQMNEFKAILPRFLALQRTAFAVSERKKISKIYQEYDMIWHTQTAYFLGPPESRTFNVFYDPSDLFLIQNIRTSSARSISLGGPLAKTYKRPYYRLLRRFLNNEGDVKAAFNIPLSKALEEFLDRCGYNHSPYMFPPCDMSFKPRVKKKRVVQVTRIVPHKRLEDFLEVARRLSDYDFLIVGSVSESEKRINPGYADKIFMEAMKLRNVNYVETRIKNNPQFLEESSVYLYTSQEPGINISAAQAAGAGCVLVTPNIGGGAEIVKHVGGYWYRTIPEAIKYVRLALEDYSQNDAENFSRNAQIFSAENFRENIKKLLSK